MPCQGDFGAHTAIGSGDARPHYFALCDETPALDDAPSISNRDINGQDICVMA